MWCEFLRGKLWRIDISSFSFSQGRLKDKRTLFLDIFSVYSLNLWKPDLILGMGNRKGTPKDNKWAVFFSGGEDDTFSRKNVLQSKTNFEPRKIVDENKPNLLLLFHDAFPRFNMNFQHTSIKPRPASGLQYTVPNFDRPGFLTAPPFLDFQNWTSKCSFGKLLMNSRKKFLS